MSDTLQRLFPQAPEVEYGFLGSLLLDPGAVMPICEERGVTDRWFYVPAHAAVFGTVAEMMAAKIAIDLRSLCQRISDAGRLAEIGGAPFVSDLFTAMPTAANAAHYLSILEEKYVARSLITVCNKFAQRGYDAQESVGELLDQAQEAVCAINRPGADVSRAARPLKEGLMESISALENAWKNRGRLQGLPSGLTKLDDVIMGFKPPQVVVVGGRPGMGKSAAVVNIAEAAARAGFPCLLFTLEMSFREQSDRFMCSVAEVNLQRVRDGFLKEADLAAKLPKAFAELAPLPIWVDETPSLSIQDLRAKTRAFKRQRPQLAAIFVDYLQLMRSNTKRAMDNRALELAEISGGLKRIAKELNIIVFAGAQLNRDADEGNKKPRLSHLRESGSIEQDADIVILLHRPGYHQEDADQKEAVAIIAKHRNGAVCDVPLEFIGEFTRFRDADPDRTGDQRRTNASRQKQQKQKNEPAGHWDGAKPED